MQLQLAPFTPAAPPPARLFQSLFAVPVVVPAAAGRPPMLDVIRSTRRIERSRIVCGMTIVTPDPALQSRMPVMPTPKAGRFYAAGGGATGVLGAR